MDALLRTCRLIYIINGDKFETKTGRVGVSILKNIIIINVAVSYFVDGDCRCSNRATHAVP